MLDVFVIRDGEALTHGPRGHEFGPMGVVDRILHRVTSACVCADAMHKSAPAYTAPLGCSFSIMRSLSNILPRKGQSNLTQPSIILGFSLN